MKSFPTVFVGFFTQKLLMFSIRQFFLTTWVMVVSLQMHGYRSCIEKERNGLLELKAYVNTSFSYDWPNDTNSNCCQWERVECDLTSGRVISLFLNDTYKDPPIQINLSLFHPFRELKTLNLQEFGCSGWFDDIHGFKSLGRLKKLEILDFGDNIVNNTVLPFLNAASSLKTLNLHGNFMEGTFPMKDLKDLINLQLLDLSENMFIGPVPGKGLADLHKLQALDLSGNKFSGSLEKQGLCQLKNLHELDLSRNEFIGPFPECFGSLTQLQVLDISSNKFNGTLPSLISTLSSLEYLSLSDNDFEGSFSFDIIANLSKLKVFKLSSKSSLLHIETEISEQLMFQLSVIELQHCNLETVPSVLRHQKDLRLINLSNNKLTGMFPYWLLKNYPKLQVLLLRNNYFTIFQLPRLLVHSLRILDISINKFYGQLPENIGQVLPNIRHLNLSSNGFQGNLPSSFGNMKKMYFLDLSRNNFSDSLPKKFRVGCSSLRILKLSYNRFSGQIFSQPTKLQLMVLIADNNLFTRIADGLLHSNGLIFLDLSNNLLQGVIPSWFRGFYFLYLSVSDNLLHGTIPSSLFNISFQLLDLSKNKFSGNLPSHFNCRDMGLLYLHNNEFSGPVPSTLLENVMLLDLRNNNFSGSIPRFVNNRYILYLLLRGNTLTGHIPTSLCDLKSIKVLDLSNNNLNGFIPSCLNNISFGRILDYEIDPDRGSSYGIVDGSGENELEAYSRSLVLPLELELDYSGYLDFSVEFSSKRRYDSYIGESFKFMFGLDLSSNELSGEIPRELGDLQRIRALNMSHNSLSGLVPKSFSNLTDIESIDLSFNVLHGPIPQDLTKLDYLVVFNVSYNNLSGSIPSQGKFLTLDKTNYIANPLLCGSPVNRSCDDNNTTDFKESDNRRRDGEMVIDMETFYWSLAATYGVTWMAFIVFLCFDSPLRRSWFRLVDAFINFSKCV